MAIDRRPALCKHCGRGIEEEPGGWLHVATAEAECWGYPHYGTYQAAPLVPDWPKRSLLDTFTGGDIDRQTFDA